MKQGFSVLVGMANVLVKEGNKVADQEHASKTYLWRTSAITIWQARGGGSNHVDSATVAFQSMAQKCHFTPMPNLTG